MHTHQKNSKRENPALSNHIFETLQHQNGTQENTRRPSGGPRASPPSLQSLQRLKVCLELMGGRAGRDRQTGGDRETDEPQTPPVHPRSEDVPLITRTRQTTAASWGVCQCLSKEPVAPRFKEEEKKKKAEKTAVPGGERVHYSRAPSSAQPAPAV